jgi:radical SAM protein with 4Fe4S-binding SPASM domain
MMRKNLKEENNELIKNFLDRTFFSAWKLENQNDHKYLNYNKLEIQVTSACDLKCKYCYYAKYHKDLYPPKISKKSLILKNLDMLLDWLDKNNLYPAIEIFSGELFIQEVGFEVLERLIDWHNSRKIFKTIVVPTNFSFLFDENKTKRIEKLIKKANGRVFLSASIDGKYCDSNRPFINKKVRDDEYYKKVFKFSKKYGYGFHPMIYSENIEKWKDNWLWFQENFEKYDIPFSNIYLLEVRNKEWNKKQINEYYKFIRFLVNWTWNYLNKFVVAEKFPEYLHANKLFNTLNIFSTVGRGLGCSMQSTVQLRLGDLTTSVCHRAAYKQHNTWRFLTDGKKITDIEALNYNLAIAAASFDFKSSPFCSYCTIRDFCNGQCLGSMFETNGDPFMVIPTVCAVEHARVAAILDELKELDLTKHFINWSGVKKGSIKLYYDYFSKQEG